MYTLLQARDAVGSASNYARGRVYVREGRVGPISRSCADGILTCSATVHAADRDYAAAFGYDEETQDFAYSACDCQGCAYCRHVAALMIAVCVGAQPIDERPSEDDLIDGLLDGAQPFSLRRAPQDAPVRLYPVLRRLSAESLGLRLKIGRTRAYMVRSMSELASRAARREAAVYGRELTFSHSEAELDEADAALFGQIVMLAGNPRIANGGELSLFGAALDQTMRLLIGREVEVCGENGESRRAKVVRGDIVLPVELAAQAERTTLTVEAQDVVTGLAGAYHLGETEICCALGDAYARIAPLTQIARARPQGVRLREAQLEAVCTRLILPAADSVRLVKGQAILAAHTPTPAAVRFYVDAADGRRLTCRVALDYCGVELAPGQTHPHIRRNAALEADACAAAMRLFPTKEGVGQYAFSGEESACFALLRDRLPQLERTGEVHVSRRLAQMHVHKPRPMAFGLRQEGDRLTLKADLGYTREELAQALSAYREKRAYVRLTSGIFLSGEALEQAADAAQVLDGLDVTAEQTEAGVEVAPSRAMYLDAALKARPHIALRAPEAISSWTQRIEQAQQTRMAQPASLRTTLRSYQLEGLSWLCALSGAGFGGILADDMELGKTVQALALLLHAREQGERVRALVVCPASLQLNWRTEAQRFAPDLTCASLTGDAKARAQAIAAQDAPELLITSYDQLRRDAQAYADIPLTHLLLDEAQTIKNAASQAARSVKSLRAAHRFAMTGTPVENRLSELWSIFDFLMPGYLGTYKKFKDRFEAPIVRHADARARENLHILVAPFILRRMKKDVLSDLPEKVETVMTSEMTSEQRRLYAAHAAALRRQSAGGLADGQSRMAVLAGLTRLRQLCCDPSLCLEGYTGGSGKLTQFLEIVRDALCGGHRLLVFSQFTSMLARIADALRAEGIAHYTLTGETDKQTRMALVEQFNAGGADVFLISLKAGGTGLNLTGADVVIHYDPWWNVAAQNQATDRAYRIGQTRGVQVIRLIASGTVEEQMLTLQEQKRALGDSVLPGDENLFTVDTELLRAVLGGPLLPRRRR